MFIRSSAVLLERLTGPVPFAFRVNVYEVPFASPVNVVVLVIFSHDEIRFGSNVEIALVSVLVLSPHVKFTNDRGSFTVTTHRTSSAVELTVVTIK